MKILLRLWDVFLYDGSVVLFQVTLGMLKIKGALPCLIYFSRIYKKSKILVINKINISLRFTESELKVLENSAQIFNALSDIPGDVIDVDQLLEVSLEVSKLLSNSLIETHRRRHLAYLMADQGGLVGNPDAVPNLPKQHLNR
jgi:hypothetical protein